MNQKLNKKSPTESELVTDIMSGHILCEPGIY